MNDTECCWRRSMALSNMLKWYYKDDTGSIYGAVDSFKLERTPFVYSKSTYMQWDKFDCLIKHLPRLERDFNEHCRDVFRCSHYMNALLREGDGEIDEDIVLIKRVESSSSEPKDRQRSGVNGDTQKSDVSQSNYNAESNDVECRRSASRESIDVVDQSYLRETSVLLSEHNVTEHSEPEIHFPLSGIGGSESKRGTHDDNYVLTPIGIPSPKLPTTAMEACKIGNRSRNIFGSKDDVVGDASTKLGNSTGDGEYIGGTKYVPHNGMGTKKEHCVDDSGVPNANCQESPRRPFERASMTEGMTSLSGRNVNRCSGKRSSSAKMISIDSVMSSNRLQHKDFDAKTVDSSERRARMSGVMLTQQMLIKQRMQSNLREAQAHLARISSRKVSHVLSQSQPLTYMSSADHLADSLHG